MYSHHRSSHAFTSPLFAAGEPPANFLHSHLNTQTLIVEPRTLNTQTLTVTGKEYQALGL